MASCKDVATFLAEVNARTVSTPLADPDLDRLQELRLIARLTPDELAQARQAVQALSADQAAIAQESASRAAEASDLADRSQHTQSFLFKLESADRQAADRAAVQQESDRLRGLDADLAQRQQQFSALLAQQATVEGAVACGAGFVALTGPGQLALRDLDARLYRVSDTDFASYWTEAAQIDTELAAIADQGARSAAALAAGLPGLDPLYLWAVAIGIAKAGGDPAARLAAFLQAYHAIERLSPNVENRLMAAEVLATMDLASAMQELPGLQKQVLRAGLPAAAALGVAAVLLSGRREDGTFALDQLQHFRTQTMSYEAAALLAILNRPYEEVSARFGQVRALLASWGFATSEDTELSSAYLAVSDVPIDTVSPKLAIIARGMATYLQYPLVASAILAAIPVLEANETLSLVEKAYEIVGQRTGQMAQPALITLAVRMVHGIQVRSVSELDSTAAAARVPGTGGYTYFPHPIWVPVLLVHGMYFSTFSGIGGFHAAPVHAFGGGGFAGGGG